MSKTIAFNNNCLYSIALNAYGCALTGHEERCLSYLRGLMQLIKLQGKVIGGEDDGLAHKEFHDLMHGLVVEQVLSPEYDADKAHVHAKRWAAKGFELPKMSDDENFSVETFRQVVPSDLQRP